MAARYPRFIITVDGREAGTAVNHDEAWMRALALWRPGCTVNCEPTELIPPDTGIDEQQGETPEPGPLA